MADLKESFEVAKKFAPEVADILDFQVTGQSILVKTSLEEDLKTKSGIIIGAAASDNVRFTMLQKATVVNVGSKVEEIKPGMEVYYYLRDYQGEIKDKEGVMYALLQEYSVKGYIKN